MTLDYATLKLGGVSHRWRRQSAIGTPEWLMSESQLTQAAQKKKTRDPSQTSMRESYDRVTANTKGISTFLAAWDAGNPKWMIMVYSLGIKKWGVETRDLLSKWIPMSQSGRCMRGLWTINNSSLHPREYPVNAMVQVDGIRTEMSIQIAIWYAIARAILEHGSGDHLSTEYRLARYGTGDLLST